MNDKERFIGRDSQFLDRSIEKPNPDTFPSAREAATNAIERFNTQSIKQNREFGGTIYQLTRSGRFSYVSRPNMQTVGFSGGHVSTAQAVPAGAVEVGRWHTHGKTENFTDEDFSDADIQLVWERQLPSWLGTPKGAVKQAIPSKGGVVVLELQPSMGTRPNIRFVPFTSGKR